MKLRLALLALLLATAVAAGASHATVSNITVTVDNLTSTSESVSGTTLKYTPGGTNSGSFDVTVDADTTGTLTSVDFPTITGMTGGGNVSAPCPCVMTYSWTASTTASASYTVTVNDDDPSSLDKTAAFAVAPVPTVKNAAPTEVSGAADQYWAEATNTVWFRPTASGSFKLNATATTAASVTFPDVSSIAGWAGSTGGVVASPFTSSVYTWSSGAGAPGAKSLTATSSSGETATAPITISGDSSPPSGQSVSLSGGPWFGGPVALTLVAGTDAGSGVDSSRTVVERASAPVTNGVCGTFGAFAAVTLSGTSDTSVASGNCYRYHLKATDNVGNVSSASTASADAKVDSTAPTTPSLLFTGFSNTASAGNVVYFRPGATGSFTVTAASSDPESGVAAYSFPAVPGFTAAGSGPHRTYVSTRTGTTAAGGLTIAATNAAGVSSGAASFTLVPDATAPTLAVRCNGKACSRKPYPKTVMVTFSAADLGGSGVDTIRWTSDGSLPTAEHGNEYTRGIPLRGLTHLKVRAFDRAGNPSSLTSLTVSSLANRLVVTAPRAVVVKAKARYVLAKIRSTRRALVSATMSGKSLKKALHWHFVLASGTSVVQLRLPKTIKRPGSYRVVWTLNADTRHARTTTRVTLRK
ncbi:MAG TPA: FN3 associated domain-containing protein [Gaiellaceae bacterium]